MPVRMPDPNGRLTRSVTATADNRTDGLAGRPGQRMIGSSCARRFVITETIYGDGERSG